ncbi:MAG: bacteriohopanetetrol glucosamine biosynthesis glycosyltransferase HpnI [Acidobacteriia bacterium]|nr:bacteriohopanetetrol glucosamine biosynthesis glycosyltransferase HpnI [Terriglobia bacterium]
MIAELLLWFAIAGLASCTGFLVLLAAAMLRFRRRQETYVAADLPSVSLLKPLCGLEPGLEANLASFFEQDYPAFEIVFGTRDSKDPALQVVRAVQKRYPQVPVKVVLSGEPDRPNAKVCSLQKMYAKVSHDYLVISDSDVRVAPNYLQEVIRPLLDHNVGLVTCLYRGVPTGGIWSRLEALGMSIEMTAGVLVADMLEGMRFALGPTMATRRDVLQTVGGFEGLADFCADDYLLGQKIYESGRQVVLSEHVIDHFACNRSFKPSILHQLRWMKSTRFSRPMGHIGTALTFAMPFGLLGAGAGVAMGRPLLGLALLAVAVLNRLLMAVTAGWGAVHDRRSLRNCWLYPVRDLMGFFFWSASFFGRGIVWRGERYRLEYGGKMVRIGGAPTTAAPTAEPASATVAVDHLA